MKQAKQSKSARIKTDEFVAYCRATKNLSDKTVAAYKQDLNSFDKYVQRTGKADVMLYVGEMMESGRKTSTVKRHIATLTQYYKYLYKNNKPANPMLEWEFKLKTEKVLPRTITVNEVKRLLAALYKAKNRAKTPFAQFEAARDLAMIDLLCSTGIRIGEAAALTYDDVNLQSRIVLIHGKGKKERLIYLSCAETVNNLRQWLKIRAKLRTSHNFVFVNRALRPISIHGIEDIFAKYRRAAHINCNSTPHYLRHTFATNLLANGSDLRSVQEILGHSNVAVTERYTEVTATRKIKVLKKYNYRNALLNEPSEYLTSD